MTGSTRTPFDMQQAWIGALATGVVTLLVWAGRSVLIGSRAGTVALAVALAAVLLALAWFAWRRGHTDRAVGIIGGYGVLTLISGGTCTITFDDSRLDPLVSGLFGYVAFLIVAFVIAVSLRWRGGRRAP
jgi:hypothetical protein